MTNLKQCHFCEKLSTEVKAAVEMNGIYLCCECIDLAKVTCDHAIENASSTVQTTTE